MFDSWAISYSRPRGLPSMPRPQHQVQVAAGRVGQREHHAGRLAVVGAEQRACQAALACFFARSRGQLAALARQAGQHVRARRHRLEELRPQAPRIGVIPGAIDRAERMDQRPVDLLRARAPREQRGPARPCGASTPSQRNRSPSGVR